MTMHATPSVTPWLAALLLAVGLAACGNRAAPPAPELEAVTDAGGGNFTLATTGASAAAAVERGLNQATQFCADRNAMIAVQGTRIEPDGYRMAFRCLEGAPLPPRAVMAARTAAPTGVLGVAPEVAAPAPATRTELGVSDTIAPPAPMDAPFAPPARGAQPSPIPVPATRSTLGLPGASSPLQPIAGPPVARQAAPGGFGGGAQPASSFWQSGR